jgi:hypothetical protein
VWRARLRHRAVAGYGLVRPVRAVGEQGDSIRELTERYGVHRRTVRAAVDSAMPAPRKKSVPIY